MVVTSSGLVSTFHSGIILDPPLGAPEPKGTKSRAAIPEQATTSHAKGLNGGPKHFFLLEAEKARRQGLRKQASKQAPEAACRCLNFHVVMPPTTSALVAPTTLTSHLIAKSNLDLYLRAVIKLFFSAHQMMGVLHARASGSVEASGDAVNH
jgi:hypothetical protein